MLPRYVNIVTDIVTCQGRSQEFSFTEARLKGKGASNAGGSGGHSPPEADAIHQSHF